MLPARVRAAEGNFEAEGRSDRDVPCMEVRQMNALRFLQLLEEIAVRVRSAVASLKF